MKEAYDFSFDDNYYNGFNLDVIDANYNWFEDELVRFFPESYIDYIKITNYDADPNTNTAPIETNRFYTALQYEYNQQYEQATALYKEILNNPMNDEKQYLGSCIDGIFRITLNQNYPITECNDYFDAKVLQYAVADSALSSLLEAYLFKRTDYQQGLPVSH